MRSRNPKPPLAPQLCAFCGGEMSDRRPPYLLRDKAGVLWGPFHAGCADRVKMDYERKGQPALEKLQAGGYFAEPAREETLPW